MMVYYLCQECLNDRALTRLEREGRFSCPVASDHDPQLHPPVMITRGTKRRAALSYSRDSTLGQRRATEELVRRVEAAIEEVFEALDATDVLASAKRRNWRALARLPHGWQIGEK